MSYGIFGYRPNWLDEYQSSIAEEYYEKYSKTANLDISEKTRGACFNLWMIQYLLDNIMFENINISGCGFSSVDHLLSNCAHQLNIIQCLNISHNKLCDDGLRWLAEVISDNEMPNLIELDISYSEIDNYNREDVSYETIIKYSIPEFADALVKNDTIETLVFSGNNMSAQVNGAGCIADVLQKNTTLMNLEISNCQITPGGAVSIAGALVGSHLQTLDISCNRIGNDGAKAFAYALEVNTVLLELDISDCKIDDHACVLIADALKGNDKSGLMTLRLKNNLITDKGAKALLGLLNTNTSLKEIDIGDNKSIKDTRIAVQIFEKLTHSSRRRFLYV
jgi:Ran GTPase-activating protein (RanGAP) involved in mRNA processing and transport